MNEEAFLSVRDLRVEFPVKGGFLNRKVATVSAVNGVSLEIERWEIIGPVIESGCGKSTFGRALRRLVEPSSESVLYAAPEGAVVDVVRAKRSEMAVIRRDFQLIFQDPYSSLNPATLI